MALGAQGKQDRGLEKSNLASSGRGRAIDAEQFRIIYRVYNGRISSIRKFFHIGKRRTYKIIAELKLEKEKYYSTTQAAKLLDVPYSTLKHMVARGDVPAIKVENKRYDRWLISQNYIEEFEYPIRKQYRIEPGYVSVQEAMRILGYSKVQILRMCRRKRLVAKQNGHGKWMIKLDG